ncbi:short-chain fatty acids transporter [Vreelandella songnenensis]|uniref:Short-chain fatty acids transporter n=1 Tax=Vreelandella songnenensis TaxID=1176243 RepID=A0A2T0V3U5_9GAMM|nr:TIGR00366 family protein [Halomonas songnenensis]PRY64855.1 short-chain fatty acids transporter [Halomonas songnenensis]
MQAMANFFTRLVSRYMPDPLVIAILLTAVTIVLAMLVEGTSVFAATRFWGDGFWGLLAFSMQMTVILLAGYILAKTPLVDRLLDRIAGCVRTPFAAIVVATLIGGIGSWLNWGFGLVIGGIVAQKLALKVKGLHYPLVIAAAYSGFALYGIGLSGSVPLLIATEGHFLQGEMGLIPLSETIFSPVLLITSGLIIATLPLFNAWLHPRRPEDIVEIDPATVDRPAAPAPGDIQSATLAERLNHSRFIGIGIGLLGMLYVALYSLNGGSLNLNTVNFTFVFLGILLFASPAQYLAALNDGVRIVSGIIIQYPFYAGIMGILVGSGLMVSFANLFVDISSAATLPIWSFISGGVINILAPSGGGQWAVQGPVMIEAATELGASHAATALAVQIGDQWTNMVQPFWILPVLAISGLKLRDVMGYMVLILMYLGVIFAGAVWLWGYLGA